MTKGMTPEEEKDLKEYLRILNKVMRILEEVYDIPEVDNVLVEIGFNPELEEATWEEIPISTPVSPQGLTARFVTDFLVTIRIKARVYRKMIENPGTLTIEDMKDSVTQEGLSFGTLVSALESLEIVSKDDIIVFLDPGMRWSEGVGFFLKGPFLGFMGYFPRYARYQMGNLIVLTALKISGPVGYSILKEFLGLLTSFSKGHFSKE